MINNRQIFLVAMLIILTFITQGCAHHPGSAAHILAIDKFGNPEDPKTGKIFPFQNYTGHLHGLIPKDAKEKTLLIYIHGGLNGEGSANDRTLKLVKPMTDSGYIPVFINWKSGFLTTYGEHLFHDRQGEYWPVSGPISSPLIFLEDVGRGVIKAPMVWWYQTNDFVQAFKFGIYPSEKNAAEINRMLLNDRQQDRFGSVPTVVDNFGVLQDQRSNWEAAGDRILGIGKLMLGLTTAPIFTSFGTGGWDTMKRRIDIMIDKDRPVPFYPNSELNHVIDTRTGAASNFFEELQRRQKADPSLRVTIIGHSMGTIVAAKALHLWPEINYDRIIFMAAACTIEDFRSSVIPHLKKKNIHKANTDEKDKECKENEKGNAEKCRTEFYNLMLHPIAENKEAHGFGIGGTGSLLDQIDNIYENPSSESRRTLGKWVNVMNGIKYFEMPELKKNIHLISMPLDGTKPTTHGAFDDLEFKNKSEWKFWLPEKYRY